MPAQATTAQCPPVELQPGDILLYSPSSLVGWLIAIKTWTMLSHVECYIGGGRVIAARLEGVNTYRERIDKYLSYVRRPTMPAGVVFDSAGAWNAVHQMLGTDYDIGAFEEFFNPWCKHRHASRVCSTVASKWLRGGGCQPFNPDISDDDISPAQLLQTGLLITVWKKLPQR